MQVAGLNFKPLAQWSRHAVLTTWSFCTLALLILAQREASTDLATDGLMQTAVLMLQSLSLIPVVGLLHWMFVNPHTEGLPAREEYGVLLKYVPPFCVAVVAIFPFVPQIYAHCFGGGVSILLVATLLVEVAVTLKRFPGLESRLGVLGALLCGTVLEFGFMQRTWGLTILSPSTLQVMTGTGLMVWIAGFFRQAASREIRLKGEFAQMDTAARQLHRIYNTSPVALMTVNADGTLQRWNQRAADAFGGDLARQPVPPVQALLGESVTTQLVADLKKHGHHHSELTLSRGGQERVWVVEAGMREADGFEVGMHEVTAHARRAATFQEIAERDELTGLPNLMGLRRMLNRHLGQLRSSSPLSCVYVDIQRFSSINRMFGRAAGDAVLKTVAEHLNRQVSAPAAVGRVRSDQFLLVLPGNELTLTRSQATLLLDLLCRTPVEYQGMSIPLTVSIGAVEAVSGLNAERLIESARLACELSRAEGAPHPYAVMADSPALADADASRQFGHQLRQKLPEAQIRLHAQAITSLRTDVPMRSVTVLPRLLGEHGQLLPLTRLQQAASAQGASGALDRLLLTQILHALNTRGGDFPAGAAVAGRAGLHGQPDPAAGRRGCAQCGHQQPAVHRAVVPGAAVRSGRGAGVPEGSAADVGSIGCGPDGPGLEPDSAACAGPAAAAPCAARWPALCRTGHECARAARGHGAAGAVRIAGHRVSDRPGEQPAGPAPAQGAGHRSGAGQRGVGHPAAGGCAGRTRGRGSAAGRGDDSGLKAGNTAYPRVALPITGRRLPRA